MAAKAGTAYVEFAADLSTLNKQVAAAVTPLTGKFGKVGSAAAVGLGAITTAAVGAGAALASIGSEFDDAYDKIRTRTGATGRELAKLEGTFKKVVSEVPASFADAADAVGGLNQRLGATGRPLRHLSKQMLELSRLTGTELNSNIAAVTRLFGDWSVATRKQGPTLDKLFRLTQQTGIEFTNLAELMVQFGSPLRQLGFSFNEAAVMFARFEKEGVNLQTLLPGLRMGLKNIAIPTDELAALFSRLGVTAKEPHDALLQIFDVLSSEKVREADRTLLASSVFGGRAWADMKAAVEEGRFEFADLIGEMRNSNDTILKTGRRTSDMSEEWQKFVNMLKVKVEPVAREVFSALSDLVRDLRRAFRRGGLDEVVRVLVEKLNAALPKILNAGVELGKALIRGIYNGFVHADLLGKLFLAGTFIRLIGGKGALASIGSKIATVIFGARFAASMKGVGKRAGKSLGKGLVLGIALAVPSLIEDLKKALEPVDDWIDDKAGEWGDALGDGFNLDLPGPELDMPSIPFFNSFREQAEKSSDAVLATLRHTFNRAEKIAAKTDLRPPINRELVGDTQEHGRRLTGAVETILARVENRGDRGSMRFARAVGGNFQSAKEAGVTALASLATQTNRVLTSLKVRGGGSKVYVASNADGGNGATLAQRGAAISVPGFGSGDKVPALLEPGEVVVNREAVKAMGGAKHVNRINEIIPRFQKGGVPGGLDFALGPYDIPPIQYAEDHSPLQNNSHVHITGTTKPWIIAIGKQLQRMGFLVGENPAFGGVNAQHSATGGHYQGLAIDVNAADHLNETRAEVASIARLLGGKGGIPGAVAEKIARVLIKGPKGPLRDMAQAAADRVRSAANRFLSRQAPTGVAPTGGVADGPIQQMARAMVLRRWGASQWPPFVSLEMAEAGWDPYATNPSSGAYGLAQALPPSKYPPAARPGANVSRTEHAKAQLAWMVSYIAERYGNPAAAWAWHQGHNWYQRGGIVGYDRGGEVIGRPLPKALQKWNRRFAPHWAPDYGGTRMPVNLVAMLAEFFGMPGKTMAQIAHGESGYRPGSAGVDKGGTKGYGLWAITTSFNDAIVRRFGGYEEMWNPIKNAIVASKLWKARGLAPWYGTQYVTGSNLHWNGDFGELVRADGSGGGGGGKGGKDKPDKPDKPTLEVSGTTALGLTDYISKRLAKRIEMWRNEIKRLVPLIAEYEEIHAAPYSEAGEELSGAERNLELGFNKTLLGNQEGLRDGLKKAISKVRGKGIPEIVEKLRKELSGLVGITGDAGAILATKSKIWQLEHPEEADVSDNLAEILSLEQQRSLELLRENEILRRQTPVFSRLFTAAPFGGVFHSGGVVPGPLGADRTIIAQGGETITPAGAAPVEVTVVVQDGAVNPSAIDVRINDRLAQIARTSSPRGGVTGRKAVYG